MSDSPWTWIWVLLGLPLAAAGVGALVVAYRNRGAKPTAARLFALGVVLLLGNAGVELLVYTLFPIHEWLDSSVIGLEVAYLLMGVLRQAISVVAALLITAAVFVPDDPPQREPHVPSPPPTGGR